MCTVCRATDRPEWVIDINDVDVWLPYLDEICAWLRAHDVDPNTTGSVAVVRRADGTRELHTRQYLTADCPDCGDYRYVDWTTGDAASVLHVTPLIAEPPDIPAARAH